MNRQAEELKYRTFIFALAIIKFCRVLRDNWEGRELSDQLPVRDPSRRELSLGVPWTLHG